MLRVISFPGRALQTKTVTRSFGAGPTRALISGKIKLGNIIKFENLPIKCNAPLWTTITDECQLTLDELFALQNAVCPTAQGKYLFVSVSNLG